VPLVGTLPKQEFYARMVKRYSEVCERERGSKKVVGESTPAYVFHLDFIDSLYPGIKKICVLRDPKDRITSWHFSLISKRRKEEGPITKEFALQYIEERVKKEYEALLRYQGSLFCTTYEFLTEHGIEALKEVCSYLGIEAPEKVLKDMIESGSFKEMTKRHSKSEGRERGDEGQWRGYLKAEEKLPYDLNPLRKGITGDWENHIVRELAEVIDAAIAPLQTEVFLKYHLSGKK
ncbi:MAG TPA: sulfotransferase domain-containing protein, partial [Candidatus Paceibacterota bacterium]